MIAELVGAFDSGSFAGAIGAAVMAGIIGGWFQTRKPRREAAEAKSRAANAEAKSEKAETQATNSAASAEASNRKSQNAEDKAKLASQEARQLASIGERTKELNTTVLAQLNENLKQQRILQNAYMECERRNSGLMQEVVNLRAEVSNLQGTQKVGVDALLELIAQAKPDLLKPPKEAPSLIEGT